jgi:hypothetical protein
MQNLSSEPNPIKKMLNTLNNLPSVAKVYSHKKHEILIWKNVRDHCRPFQGQSETKTLRYLFLVERMHDFELIIRNILDNLRENTKHQRVQNRQKSMTIEVVFFVISSNKTAIQT